MTSLNDFKNMYWSIIEKNKILKKEIQIKDNTYHVIKEQDVVVVL